MSPSTSCLKNTGVLLKNKHICSPNASRLLLLCYCLRRCQLTCITVFFMDYCVLADWTRIKHNPQKASKKVSLSSSTTYCIESFI